jgi:predicted transcriptional regulator
LNDSRDQPRELRLQDTIRLSADGVAKVLGDLEARVMHVVWAVDRPATARSVHQRVYPDHPVALHTVITILNKLVEKGLLRRDKIDAVLHYSACYSEAEFRQEMAERAVRGILSLGQQAVAASFVDVLAKHDPAQLAALLRMIQQRITAENDEEEG